MCYAKLSIDGNFEYFKTQVGLDRLQYEKNVYEFKFSSPFFLEDQVKFFTYKSDLNINFLGGCCGINSNHISEVSKILK